MSPGSGVNGADSRRRRERIRACYDDVAPRFDGMLALMELLGLSGLRRRMLRAAFGEVLELAAGTGRNLPWYPAGCRVTAMDLSAAMLGVARRRARRLGRRVRFLVMDAERLAFPDASFDTVVDSLSLCTIPDPVAALREMSRVRRPGGRILLLEHGRSQRGWLARWQDRTAQRHDHRMCCRWNLDPQEWVGSAGLELVAARRFFLGMFHVLEVAPAGEHRARRDGGARRC